MQDQPLHKFRRAMVILSDGEDNQSRYTRDQALEMAQKADVVIYTISTNITPHSDRWRQGDEVLRGGNRRPGVFPVQGARTWTNRSRTSPTNCGTSTAFSTARSR